jgi:hypothetical protein
LGDGGTVRKLVVATTAGADDAMPARREKAIFGFLQPAILKSMHVSTTALPTTKSSLQPRKSRVDGNSTNTK